jgi:UDP-N-acetyl-D-glucosamine dehydrogenase
MAGVRSADVTVIVTDHTCYPYAEIVQNANVVVDTRNATKGIASEKILKI